MELSDLRIKIFADGADLAATTKLAENPLIKGFTTNPTLMRKAGISDYAGFAREVLRAITDRPISFEVFSDEFDEMERQALIINSWAHNVYVKIPITNTRAESAVPLIHKSAHQGLKLNITAMTTLEQIRAVGKDLQDVSLDTVKMFYRDAQTAGFYIG
jgi:transaldolase